jgi:Rrf2 family protein
MRLPRAGEYAIRCVLYLSRQGQGVLVPRKEVAAEMDIPHPFLAKVAQQLARAGLIDIVQGSRGGFRLALPPENISMLAVLEAVVGNIYLNDCILRPDSCHRSPECEIHRIWEKIVGEFRSSLASARFSEFIPHNCPSSQPPQKKGV